MVVAKMNPWFFITMSVMIFYSCNACITIKNVIFHFFKKISFLGKNKKILQSRIFCFYLLRLIIVNNKINLNNSWFFLEKIFFFDKNENHFFIKFLWFYFFRNFGFFMKNQFFEKKWKNLKKWKNFEKKPFFFIKIAFFEKNYGSRRGTYFFSSCKSMMSFFSPDAHM